MFPASSGIGGGCYILTHNGTTLKNEFIDSREYAPKGSTFDMFQKDPLLAQDGGLAVAVFSELKGEVDVKCDNYGFHRRAASAFLSLLCLIDFCILSIIVLYALIQYSFKYYSLVLQLFHVYSF